MRKIERLKKEVIGLYAELDLGLLLDKIADKIKSFLNCEEASIYIYNPRTEELSFEIATGEKGRELKQIILKKGEGIAGWIAAHNQPLIVNDCATDPRFAQKADQKTRFRTRSILGVPVCLGNSLLGVLEAINKKRGGFGRSDQQLLEFIAHIVTIPLQNAIYHRQTLERERIVRELQIARRIQESFLVAPGMRVPGLDVAYLNIPSSTVGGDYYDIIPLNPAEVILTVNDVCGHGIPASLLMAIFRTNFVYCSRRDHNLQSTVSHLNKLIAETTDPSLYVTSFSARLDTERQRLSYINAGHPPPLLLRGDACLELDERATVIGLFPDAEYPLTEVELQPGDRLLFYTDGLVEAENPDGEPFGMERLREFLRGHRGLAAEELKNELIRQLREFVVRDSFEDDVTLIAVHLLND